MGRIPVRGAFVALVLVAGVSPGETRGIDLPKSEGKEADQAGLYSASHALVIGVAKYEGDWPDLPSVVEETASVEVVLKSHGFSVRRVLNPNEETLKREFEVFIDKYGYLPDNRLLVFFSGHGYSRSKGSKGYLVPSDAPNPRGDETGFLRKALAMSQILAWCRQMEAKHAIFLFDSCFSGTIFKSKTLPEPPAHVTQLTARPVRQFISAGDAGERVPARSVFAACFVKALRGDGDTNRDGYITGTELGAYLNEQLLTYETGQHCQYGKIRDPLLDEGDFVFTLGQGLATRAQLKEEEQTPFQRDLLKLIEHSKAFFVTIRGKADRASPSGGSFYQVRFEPESFIRFDANLVRNESGEWRLPSYLVFEDYEEASSLFTRVQEESKAVLGKQWQFETRSNGEEQRSAFLNKDHRVAVYLSLTPSKFVKDPDGEPDLWYVLGIVWIRLPG